ncbi:KilA-N domain-containing protein [Deinococcus soli (ex Cha et al. 2016)]|uniref:KilA-N domain-containing protein n=1 Tax=Deinococcus soli (ex Cha et al. 2016) TaxID=1309411 RepID=UPI0019BBB568|nr:KilA-N domain-containing protein [Deinococcus soli (ex Cha et al. 2016)]GGB71652.1 hypothetical protein GCM10008019_29750 [Deinococcus soli (ex Cha et al. 2016)]
MTPKDAIRTAEDRRLESVQDEEKSKPLEFEGFEESPKELAMAAKILVQGNTVEVVSEENEDYISLTDMVKGFDQGRTLIDLWLRNKNTIMFLAVWERINNPSFDQEAATVISNEAGANSFTLSVKRWAGDTGAVGIKSRQGRGGGTYAHKDIAFEFGSWLSPEFKLYLIKEFQRLKELENARQSLDWDLRRTLVKLNYRIHTDAVKDKLVKDKTKQRASLIYATEADVINMAIFGITAKEFREAKPHLDGNMRDYASVEQLLVLANIESMNAELIKEGLSQGERLAKLTQIADEQMLAIQSSPTMKALKAPKK